MSLATSLAGIELEHPLMNAGGTCKTVEDVRSFAASNVAAVMINLLIDVRPGNSGTVYYRGPSYSLNSFGLPSRGETYYDENLAEMIRIVHNAGKKAFVNISGFAPWEYAKLAKLAVDAGVDLIELNFGCPNIWQGRSQKQILSFNVDGMRHVLRLMGDHGIDTPISLKLSPFTDPAMIEEICVLVASSSDDPVFATVNCLTLCNTFPNAYMLDSQGKPVIDVGLAGLGGAAMKPIALGQLKQFKMKQEDGYLPEHIQFIGVGGVSSGQDVIDYKNVGASAVQAATAYFNANENPRVYTHILTQYVELAG